MTNKNIYIQLGGIDEEMILEAAPSEVVKNKKWNFYFDRKAAAVCMGLVILLVGFAGVFIYQNNYAVATTVSLDVNPSLEIKVNEKEKVLEVVPLNEDGAQVVGNMDFNGSSIEVTVNALVGSMFTKGYIDSITNSILLTVEGEKDTTELCERLTKEIDSLINTDNFDVELISQMIKVDKELKSIAKQYGISTGKAQLINTILEARPELKTEMRYSALAKLSVAELCHLLGDDDFTQTVVEYIGKDGAVQKVKDSFKNMGINEKYLKFPSVILRAVYKVRYMIKESIGGTVATSIIDAITGEYLNRSAPDLPSAIIISLMEVPEGHITPTEAGRIFANKLSFEVKGLYYKSITLQEDGSFIYHIYVKNESTRYDIKISSKKGEILEYTESEIKN